MRTRTGMGARSKVRHPDTSATPPRTQLLDRSAILFLIELAIAVGPDTTVARRARLGLLTALLEVGR